MNDPLKSFSVGQVIKNALQEDIGRGDVTSQILIPLRHSCTAHIVFKSDGILCGLPVAKAVLKHCSKKISFEQKVREGTFVHKGTIVAHIKGPTRCILTAERVMLNFLSHMSSIATHTYKFVEAVKPYPVHIMDTRKTTPTLRVFERYAVATGGGFNHRFNLNDMVMIKDNHYAVNKSPVELVNLVRRKTSKRIILEVDNLNQLSLGLKANPDIILLDNMTHAQTKAAVMMRDKINPNILLESSGGITLKNVRSYAACRVDRISIGALTQRVVSVDVSLDVKI